MKYIKIESEWGCFFDKTKKLIDRPVKNCSPLKSIVSIAGADAINDYDNIRKTKSSTNRDPALINKTM